MKRRHNQRKGFALILVMTAVAMGVVLGVSYVSSASIRLRSSANLMKAARARYLAESGLNHGLYLLVNDLSAMQNSSEANPLGPYALDDSGEGYLMWAEQDPFDADIYTLYARSDTIGVQQRTSLTAQRPLGYADRILANNPVAYWRLGEAAGTVAVDSSGNNLNADYEGGVDQDQDGAILSDTDSAVYTDGTDDYLHKSTTDELKLSDDMTISLWLKPDELPADEACLITYSGLTEGPGDNVSYQIVLTDDGEIDYLQEYGNGKDEDCTFEDLNIEADTWLNLVLTRNRGDRTIRLYLDGQFVGSWDGFGPPPHPNSGKDGELYIGSAYGADSFLNGHLDDIALFDQELSAEEILALYNAGRSQSQVQVLTWED